MVKIEGRVFAIRIAMVCSYVAEGNGMVCIVESPKGLGNVAENRTACCAKGLFTVM